MSRIMPPSGANNALSNLSSTLINTSLISDTDSTDDLGSSSKYWANGYFDKIYFNSTAIVDGDIAGMIKISLAADSHTRTELGFVSTGTNLILQSNGFALGESAGAWNGISTGTLSARKGVGGAAALYNGIYAYFYNSQDAENPTGVINAIFAQTEGWNTGNGKTWGWVNGVASKVGGESSAASTGVITNVVGFHTIFNSDYTQVTNVYGLYVDTNTAIGTNRYGIYLNNISGGTLNYAIYTNVGLNHFGGALEIVGNISPTTDSARDLGTSSLYWSNTYTDKLYLNATATLDGATAGQTNLTGNFNLQTTSSTVGQILVNGTKSIHFYGTSNVFIGGDSGNFTFTGTGNNVGIGANTLDALTSGHGNLAIGGQALTANQGGHNNTGIGGYALAGNTSGGNNLGIGNSALQTNTTANDNVAIGNDALTASNSANNVAIGSAALTKLTSGKYNTAIGFNAGHELLTNDQNVFLGYQAGYYETGASKLFIDNATRASEADGRVKALIYGVFASTTAAQYLTVNGNLTAIESINIPVDSKSIVFGGGNDASIYYDGTNLVVNPKLVGTGAMTVLGGITAYSLQMYAGSPEVTMVNVSTGQYTDSGFKAYNNASSFGDYAGVYVYQFIEDTSATISTFAISGCDYTGAWKRHYMTIDQINNATSFNTTVNTIENYKVDGTQVVSNRVVDARCDDAINSGDATTDGVIDALRDAMISHGLIAAA